ncbi:hypothetical protein Bca52824_017664 [Brassica carinata]|uniref:NAC domain-containing protein n=1 Tax=Brassica carinata TaxID=52824 RepID=A0A8X8AXL9_BRACI|nr:hypothetical protein Bca52824_017664 [Brassica carinata]
MEEKPGFEFRPYDEELVGFYLRHKILGNDSLVGGVIREIKICSLDPWDLHFQSKIKSRDLVWYFLSRREDNGSRQRRRTPSGFWKLTGDPVDVDQSLQGNSGHYNTFSEYDSAYQGHQFNGNFDTQQLLQYFNPTSEYDLANQSHWFTNPQQQHSATYQDDSDMWKQVVEENWPSLVDERPLVMNDDDTDSTIGRDTWSSTDSVGSKDGPYHTPKDSTPSVSTVELLHHHEAQEQPKQLELKWQGKEKVINKQHSECEWKMAEDAFKKAPPTSAVKQSWIVLEEISQKNSRWIYLKNIIGLLLFIFIIGCIILVG